MWYTEFRAHARDSDLPRQGRSWQFDLTFLTSKYRCIWGRGCPDTKLHGTARGCCVEGVEIYQGEGDAAGLEDVEMIRGRVEQMTSSRIACSLWTSRSTDPSRLLPQDATATGDCAIGALLCAK